MRKQALELLEQVVCEMEAYQTQRSEAWQDSDRAETFGEIAESLAQVMQALEEIPSNLAEA